MNNEIEAKIEYRQEIGEVNPGSYRPVRFARIKYKASSESHIDIRQYQRGGYDKDGKEAYHPTKVGFRFLEREFVRVIKDYVLIPENYIPPLVWKKSLSLLKNEQFESAVLQAFKVLETSVRKLIGAPADEVGISLLRRAFHPVSGPLTDKSLPMAEREALSHFIAGAFGYYKNACSHRDVDMNIISAFERIVVASNLLKIVERNATNASNPEHNNLPRRIAPISRRR
jgi:uncharacterized protein (TIGR02391 family)